jgi:PBP1b-binding outer membrane lipoprotein LpoB
MLGWGQVCAATLCFWLSRYARPYDLSATVNRILEVAAVKLLTTLALGAIVTAAGLAGCTREWDIDRRDPAETIDLDYRFNDADAREIAQIVSQDALSKPWLDNWFGERGGDRPMIVVGNIRNETDEYIEPAMFTSPIEEELLNSGRVRVKAQRELRAELRDERLDIDFNDPASVKRAAMEVNADLMLVGAVRFDSQKSRSGNRMVRYYQAGLELIDVETAEKLWIYNHEIKKRAER